MDFKNMKVSIGIVITIVAQAFGLIWYVAQLDSNVSNLNSTVNTLQEQATTIDIAVLNTDVNNIKQQILDSKRLMDEMNLKEFDSSDLERSIEKLEKALSELKEASHDLKTRDSLIENEMRTIMSDHSGFSNILKDMGKDGYGDTRQYGDYK